MFLGLSCNNGTPSYWAWHIARHQFSVWFFGHIAATTTLVLCHNAMAAALLQSFGLNAVAILWHLPLAGSCPAAIIWPQCCSNPVAFTSGQWLPCCNHSTSMPWKPCGIYLSPAAALLQSFGLNASCIRPFFCSPFWSSVPVCQPTDIAWWQPLHEPPILHGETAYISPLVWHGDVP